MGAVVDGRKGRWPKADGADGIEDVALVFLEWLGEQGIGAMIRIDAERLQERRPPWTFAASGGPLSEAFRVDAATAGACLAMAIERLRAAGVDVPF